MDDKATLQEDIFTTTNWKNETTNNEDHNAVLVMAMWWCDDGNITTFLADREKLCKLHEERDMAIEEVLQSQEEAAAAIFVEKPDTLEMVASAKEGWKQMATTRRKDHRNECNFCRILFATLTMTTTLERGG
jgi:hypothetical protein